MKYLHTMVRVADLDQSIEFYCNKMGMQEISRYDNENGRFTLVFLSADEDLATTTNQASKSRPAPALELTYNWDKEAYTGGRNFGHLAFSVKNIHETCKKLMNQGVIISRPPRDGRMAFVRSPDNISIEILQEGDALTPQEPWISMQNTGEW